MISHFIMDSLSCDVYDLELIRLCEEIEENEDLCEAARLVSQLHREASSQIGRGVKRTAAVLETEEFLLKKNRPAAAEPVTSTSPEPVPDVIVSTNNNHEIECSVCNKFVSKRYFKNHLNSNLHKNNVLRADIEWVNVQLIENAFKNRVATYRILLNENVHQPFTPESILLGNKDKIFALLDRSLTDHHALKVNFILNADFTQESKQVNNTFDFQLCNNVVDVSSDKDEIFESVVKDILTKLFNFERKDSGWSLVKFNYLDVNVNKFNPLRGSSYIELPRDIQNRKAVINVKNSDHECFRWAVLSGLYPPTSHRSNTTKSYIAHKNKLNFGNLTFPLKVGDIQKFEKMNDISINVFGLEYNSKSKIHDVVGPLHLTKCKKATHLNLLYISKDSKGHYCYIKNLSRLVSKQLSNTQHAAHICDGCLSNFTTRDNLMNHQRNDCFHVCTHLPSEQDKKKNWFNEKVSSNILTFDNYERKLRVPFVIYADFEAFLNPIQTGKINPTTSSTTNIQKHEVYSFGYYIKCSYNDKLSVYRTYKGKNCTQEFMKYMEQDLKAICRRNTFVKTPLPLSNANNVHISQSSTCYICDKNLNEDSVISYNYHTGLYEGVAHKFCFEKYRAPNFVPVFFHNLCNYDSHFIVHGLGLMEGDIELIPENKEKYISFSKNLQINNRTVKLRFVDSLKFMSSSLDKLAKNLLPEQFHELKLNFSCEEDFKRLLRKGVYPYEHMSSYDSLNLTALPSKDDFFSSLSDSHISEEDYDHAKDVWSHFQCKNMGDYSDLYLKTDVLLLTDIFENFRNLCLKTYGLDPAHYYTAPGLSWDAMLRTTKIKLELLTDIDKIAFIAKNIRGGISQCSNRYAKANNIFLSDYNQNIPSSFLMYFDANNLYGWAMSQCLPTGKFEWVNTDTDFNISDDADHGLILEVDLEYPNELHDSHSDLPFCPENVCLGNSKEKKIIPNLNKKTNYVIHYRNLKQCLKNGLKLSKIHRILKFQQFMWLKSYIDLNTHMRSQASSDFEKDFFKLMNNSVFGKTMENVAKRVNVKLLNNWENRGKMQGVQSLIAKPEFHSLSIFSENLVAVQLNKTRIFYNKPIYLGFCVLDVSKTLMYDFHYSYMKTKYPDNLKLLYTDTDSLVYQIFTENYYADIKSDLNLYFDTSDYPPSNKYDLPLINKKRLGFFKDENNGRILKEFVGLRSKMYTLDVEKYDENDEKTEKYGVLSKAKGVNKCVTKKLTLDNYKTCLFNKNLQRAQMLRFKSIKHIIFTQKINKISLSHEDTKRYLLENSSDTLAWGHYKIPQ
ncbi:uncharacterized protein LOC134674022 [Cydia fagiglandana]|uniref:uncharacterized protein LOC134674022 n=1 Tax=Cydia fagiglandana TaxID=1458189 RepID=UPI002FEE0756